MVYLLPSSAIMLAIIAVAFLIGAVGGMRRFAPPLSVTLIVGLGLRLLVLIVAIRHTPRDVAVYFQHVGEAVLRHQDPLLVMPRYQWNFLPAMPYVHALEILTGLPWQVAGKICPLLADMGTIYLVGSLAATERAARARWQYAVHPLPLLVVSWHGQIEPTAVALGLAALWLARRGRTGLGGLLLGLAVSVKTWPVLFAPGTLRETPMRRWPLLFAAAAMPPLLLLVSMPILLNSDLRRSVPVLISYRSFVGDWGWVGVEHIRGAVGRGYAGPRAEAYQQIGTIAVLVALVLVVLAFWRRVDGVELTAALMLVFLAVTAGFGVQYLLWPSALLIVAGGWRIWPYLTFAGLYAAYFYLIFFPMEASSPSTHPLIYGSLPIIAAALLALPWGRLRPKPRIIDHDAGLENALQR
jgi:Glycosyltransferase family 87